MTFYGVWKWKWKGGNGPDCGFKRCMTGKHQLDWARSYYCVLTLDPDEAVHFLSMLFCPADTSREQIGNKLTT